MSTYDTEEHAHWTPDRADLNARIQALGIQMDPPEFFEVTTGSVAGAATHLRATRGRFADPSKIDEAAKQVGPDLAATISRLPGCLSFIGGIDRATGQTISISTWDNEDHARWSAGEALGDIPSRFQALTVQVEQPEFFEVTTTA